MKTNYTLLILIPLLVGCGNDLTQDISLDQNESSTIISPPLNYIEKLEKANSISYDKIINTRGAYITSMCYTQTTDTLTEHVFNPCYSCHTKGKIPNYYNDTNLQKEYNFPAEVMKNPFTNLFKDRSDRVEAITDSTILGYVRESNYFSKEGTITLAMELPKEWKGYRPDCYFNFDEEGFDLDNNGTIQAGEHLDTTPF